MRARTKIAALLLVGSSLTGCQYGYRGQSWTPEPSTPQGFAVWTHDGTKAEGWTQPASPNGYGVWQHDVTVDNGCNEFSAEHDEVDNQGNLCKSFVP